jgi:hypothetical protein
MMMVVIMKLKNISPEKHGTNLKNMNAAGLMYLFGNVV